MYKRRRGGGEGIGGKGKVIRKKRHDRGTTLWSLGLGGMVRLPNSIPRDVSNQQTLPRPLTKIHTGCTVDA